MPKRRYSAHGRLSAKVSRALRSGSRPMGKRAYSDYRAARVKTRAVFRAPKPMPVGKRAHLSGRSLSTVHVYRVRVPHHYLRQHYFTPQSALATLKRYS